MSGWNVTANDIKEWTVTKKREAEETLPQLVKKLVLASCKPKSLNFPSGDSVAIGGWDGILDVEEGNEFIPVGKSGWEFGTNVDVMKKADEDYEKRTKSPEPFTIDESTFVFVTSRFWTKKDGWVKAKKAQGNWKDVKGMDAETLQSWLECCPAVHRWFANLIGKRTSDLWDIEQAWNTLSNVTKYALTPDIFINARDTERGDLLTKLGNEASVLRIKALSKIESYGFILSTLMNEDKYTSRILIVKNQPAWDWLMNFGHPLLLIPDNFTPNGIGEAVKKGHHVIIAIDSMDSASTTIELKRMSRQNRIDAIKSIGLPEDKAVQLYRATKGYLEPMIRHRMLSPRDIPIPGWVEKVNSDILFSVLFASEWDENNPNDKEIMGNLSGLDYEAFEKNVIELSKQPDPPVRLVGNIWQVISKVDMWLRIVPRLARPHLARLGEVSQKVLKDLDPSFNLAPEELFMPNIKGIVPLYSEKLRKGIADSLALLSTYGDDYADQIGSENPSDFVRRWVWQLFEGNVEAAVWYSLGSCLETIAEAAPDEFIAALEKAMYDNEPPVIKELFLAEGNGCPHSHLLWSLERISWNKQYLTKISICLARLSEIDPGGRYSNRPFESLKNIFLGWINNTCANHLERLQIIEHVLLNQFPDITWKLMVSLIPDNTTIIGDFVQKPKYSEWADGIRENVSYRDYLKYIRTIVEILFLEVDKDIGKRLPDLLANCNSYFREQKEAFFARLINIDPNSLESDDREEIIKKIRGILHDHRKFSDTNWAFPEVLLEKLENVYHHFEFADIIKKNIYLFESQPPQLIKPTHQKKIDYDEMIKIIDAKRIEVIEEIFSTRAMEGIKELAQACKYPGIICSALTQSKYSEQVIPEILSWLGSDGQLNVFATSYLSTNNHKDFDRAQHILEENQEWDNNKKSSFLLSMPKTGKTFELVEKQCNDVQRKYWNGLQCYALSENEKRQIPYVAKKFLENERPADAITLIAQVLWSKQEIDNLETSLVADILMKIVSAPSDIDDMPTQNVKDAILKAIKFIQTRADLPAESISQIEWEYLKKFRFKDIRPRYLFEKIAKEPSFFVQLVAWVYRREDGKAAEENLSEELKKRRAEKAWKLLDTVSILPGSDGSSINSENLNAWVDQARKKFDEIKCLNIGDELIGKYLSHCPPGNDRIWPHEAVRFVIENARSVELDRGIYIGELNSRGITTRSPYDGGEQERKLTENYEKKAKKIELIYPRTAVILRDLARSYKRDAKRMDDDVELLD
jgi:hypothetical protein